jgi:Na+/H+ antiporter
VLGAALAPTDATAVGVIARALPRRMVTTLRAESLINDGTALVIYGIAVSATVGEQRFGIDRAGLLFLLAYTGGAIAGLLTAWLALQARRRLDDPLQENLVGVLTPFVAFLLAQPVHASGVLAVVVCGLTLSQAGPRVIRAGTRQQAEAFWGLAAFLLNGALFVLIGLQAQQAVRALEDHAPVGALRMVVIVSAVVIGTRFTWLFTTPYLLRMLDRRPQQRLRRVGPRPRVVNAVAGFRGAVSLAAALSVPQTLASGAPFPGRNTIIFVTSGVVVVTLVVQGLLLPVVVRWAHLPPDLGVEEERRLAEKLASEEAFAALPDLATRLGTDGSVVDRMRTEYDKHLTLLAADPAAGDDDNEPFRRAETHYTRLRLELLGHKRATIVRLRDERRIDDTVLREIQSKLDVEEVRLSRRQSLE